MIVNLVSSISNSPPHPDKLEGIGSDKGTFPRPHLTKTGNNILKPSKNKKYGLTSS